MTNRLWRAGIGGVFITLAFVLSAADEKTTRPPAISAAASEWRALAESFARKPDGLADFVERRTFPFRREAVVLEGEVRVSRRHGLSLSYVSPDQRIVIVDAGGVLVRDARGEKPAPDDPRARVANEAMFHILRFDLAALEKSFELFGAQGPDEWSLTLVPRDESVRRAIGDIHVAGDNVSVRRIELRRSARQHIEVVIAPPKAQQPFTDAEVKRYFRSGGSQ